MALNFYLLDASFKKSSTSMMDYLKSLDQKKIQHHLDFSEGLKCRQRYYITTVSMFFVLHFQSEKTIGSCKVYRFFLLYRKMKTNSTCSHLHICWNFAVVVNIFKRNTLFIHKLHFHVCKLIICLLEIDYRLNVLKYTITFHNNMTSISLLKSRQIVLNALSNIGIY